MNKFANSGLYRLFLGCLFIIIATNLLFAGEIKLSKIGHFSNKTAISWGVPFSKGEISKNQEFVLKTDSVSHPVQSWPLAFWPDGSIKWLGMAAVVSDSKNFSIIPVKPSPQNVITVNESNTEISVDNELYTWVFPKSGDVLIKSIFSYNKIIAENGRLSCSLKKNIDENTIKINEFSSQVQQVLVEQIGAVRTVIKISGVYSEKSGKRQIFPFVVRAYIYKGVSEVRLVHSFVFDGNQETDFVKSIGILFDVPLREQNHNRHIRFTGENGGIWNEAVKPLSTRHPFIYKGDKSLPQKQFAGIKLPNIGREDSLAFNYFQHLPSWNDYKLTQLNPNGFSISKRTNAKSSWLHADDGKRALGLVLVGDVSGGLAVALKDFWQSYPASLEVANARATKAQLKVWFWSPESEAMDLRHYDTIVHDLNTTYEDVQEGLSTPYGIARTHELLVCPFTELPEKEQTVSMANTVQQSPLLVCTPQYLHQQKAFGTWSLPDKSNETKLWIENKLDSSIHYYKQSIEERHWFGFWNYGDVMHTYDPIRHVWKYDIGGFAWDNTELAPNNWLWYSFLRSGREDIFRMAEAMTRHTSEVDAYHLGEMKGLGTRHNVSHWGCGSKEARIGQAVWKRFYYYLTTDERSGDLMQESLDAEKALVKFEPLRIAQPREKFPYSGPMRLRWGPDWIALAGNWFTAWERTGEKYYKDKILTGFESLSKLPDNLFTGPNGLSYDPATGKLWYDGKPGLVNINHLSTIMGGFELLTEMFNAIDHKEFRKTFTDYCKFYSMDKNDSSRNEKTKNWGDVNFRTPRLTAFAAKELEDEQLAKRAWNEFLGGWSKRSNDNRNLQANYGTIFLKSAETLNPVHENPFVGTNGTAQWGLNAIFLLEFIGDKIPDPKTDSLTQKINNIENLDWKVVLQEDFKSRWGKYWFLDGEKATLKNTKNGLIFKAGETPANDSNYAVLWTKQSFKGDIKVDFDYIRTDSATKFVNILYLFAEGSGVGAYENDISKWNQLRKIPAMKTYFNHMNAYHISFAAFENDNLNPTNDYIRARRYLPETNKGLVGTELLPDYFYSGMFKPDVKYHITAIKKESELLLKVTGDNKTYVCGWNTKNLPDLCSGRIGIRLMAARSAIFSSFKVSEL